ncbi:MAG: ABC transporter permease subunit [Solirubrobacterales bacterium]
MASVAHPGEQRAPGAYAGGPSRARSRARAGAALRSIPILALLAVLVVLLLLPVAAVIYGSFRSGSPSQADTHWTWANYAGFWPTVIQSGALLNSVLLGLSTTIIAVGLGAAFAFVAERTDVPGWRLITPMMALGLFVFPMMRALGWALTANPYIGAINVVARNITGDKTLTVFSTSGWAGVILVVSLAGTQACYFLFLGSFGRLGRDLEEASIVAGRNRLQTLARVTVPLLLPLAGSIAIIAFLVQFQIFTEPYVLGSHPTFMMTQIVNEIKAAARPSYGPAGVVGVITVSIALSLGLVQAFLLRGRDYEIVRGRSGGQGHIELGRGRRWVTGGIFVFFALAVLIPVISILLASLTPYPGNYSSFGFAAYQRVFANTALMPAVRNSITYAFVGALIAVVLALGVAVVRTRVRARIVAAGIGLLMLLALGLPGVVQALGITWAYTTVPLLKQLYGTDTLVLIALVVIALPVLSQIIYGALRQISEDLEDAAVVAGSPRFVAFCRVTLPLLLPSLLGSWFIAALIIFGNLEIPLLLGQANSPVLVELAYSLFSKGDRAAAAALTTLLLGGAVAIGLLVIGLRRLLGRRLASVNTIYSQQTNAKTEVTA